MSLPVLQGSCACGQVTYTGTATPQHLDYCYCKICQQVSGAPFLAFAGIERASLQWTGPINWFRSTGFAARSFCKTCGSTLTLQYDCYPDKTHLAAGTLVKIECELPKVGMHIWVKSKPAWFSISDDQVPRYEEFDEEFLQVQAGFIEAKG